MLREGYLQQQVQTLRINVQRFRGGLVFKARRLVYHSTLGWRVIHWQEDEDALFVDAEHAAGSSAAGSADLHCYLKLTEVSLLL